VTLVLAVTALSFLIRGTVVKHVRGVGADGRPISPDDPDFGLSVAVLTGAPLSAGNRVELALDGDGTFPRLWDDLRAARESILIQSYYGNAGTVARTIRDILVERASAGVRVRVLYDAFGTGRISAADREALRAAGVTVVPFRPLGLSSLYALQNRSHVRSVVIDSRVAWTGGFGFDDCWLGDGHTSGAWRETNVRFEGPAVHQLRAAFAAAWTEATGVMVTSRGMVERHDDAVALAGLLATSPTLGSTSAERFLALSIAGARKTLYVTNAYFAPDETFVGLLVEAARRGVDVRLLVGGQGTDVRIARRAGRATYATLLAAGVRVYEWIPSTLHAKTMVVDGLWSSIGSMNFDNRSLVLNDEAAFMVLDPEFGRKMDEVFLADLAHAHEIDSRAFAERPWTERVAEWGAMVFQRVL
jgi:cardiolipin synthase